MPSTTPNLGLFKRDPVTEGNQYFNIQEQINDPLDVIDEKVGGELVDKPSTAISLTSGAQIINSPRKGRLRNVKMTGRTLVNHAGRTKTVTGWTLTGAIVSTDSTGSLSVTTTSTNGYVSKLMYAEQNKYYLVAAKIKHGLGTNSQVNIGGLIGRAC
ncbi:hypothetical protein [Cohnella caldifontis]|uniref:hypothetical protein n=1 Tax=Cohnella caldifontis TaxID=3027471 RepID=UPI0023EB95B9|nr:hypothetical protein [Cohnella sp. YIM B05605]